MQTRITKAGVERATVPAGKRDVMLWDDDVQGFCCRVPAEGRPTFWTWKRGPSGRIRATIGSFGTWTVEQARAQAVQDAADILAGRDPSERGPAVPGKGRRPWAVVDAERAAAEAEQLETAGPDVASLCERYLREWARPRKKPRSAAEDERNINLHILPAIGDRPIARVTRADVSGLLHAMRETPTGANRTRALLSKMFNLAAEWGLRPDGAANPVAGTTRYKEKKRERFLTDVEKRRLGKALADEPEHIARAIRLYLLAGFRRDELLTARFDAVDYRRKIITLSDSKTGKRAVHLGPAALEIIQQADDGTSPYIIPGRGPRNRKRKGANVVTLPGADAPAWPRHTIQRAWQRIREKARLPDVRLHDLRHSHASDLVAAGFSLKHVAAQLGHTSTRMSERYAHVSDEGVRAAVAAAEKQSAAILGGTRKKRRKTS